MSGTSLDGVDAAWIETDGALSVTTGAAVTLPYDSALRADLRRLLDLAPELEPEPELAPEREPGLAPGDPFLRDVERRLTERHAEAVAGLAAPADVIGMHGQTILHRPDRRRTWQIGDAGLLARRTGLPVVHDFRAADMAAGGQGAPLAPLFHAALAEAIEKPLAVLNIGGVANVTFVGADGTVTACDTGPGNALLDDWAMRHTGAPIDRDGTLARAGRVDAALLRRLLAHPYFALPAPKSLDRLAFHGHVETSGLAGLSAADGAATLVAFTVETIAGTVLPAPPRRWLVCGGGRRNPYLLDRLRARLGAPVDPVEAAGWDGDAIEAQCFGFLAVRSLRGLPLSLPSTTGCAGAPCGGVLVQPDR
jgi:anhydro-N-acetylmuramic acid kinase